MKLHYFQKNSQTFMGYPKLTYFLLFVLTNIYRRQLKNASLIITDFLAMIYKNEQPHTASLCRGWTMLENDFKGRNPVPPPTGRGVASI